MNFIQQAYKGDLKLWKYLVIPALFFGITGVNLWMMSYFNIDPEAVIKQEIAKKGANLFLIENLLPFAVLLLLLFLWVRYAHKQSITALTTSRKKIDWRRFWFSFGLWSVIMIISFGIDYALFPQDYLLNFKLLPFIKLSIIGILLIPLQTAFEEYFFRAYLMQGIGVATKRSWIALLSTSVIFGLLHMGNPEVAKIGDIILVYYIASGFFMGIITLMDQGIELSLGFHTANNLVMALLATSDWTAFQTDSIFIDVSKPSFGGDMIITLLFIYPLLLFIFARKYGWRHWKKNLLGNVKKPINLEK